MHSSGFIFSDLNSKLISSLEGSLKQPIWLHLVVEIGMRDVEVFVVEVWNVEDDFWMEVDVVTRLFDEDELEACAEEEDRNTVVEVVVDLEVDAERRV
jgi:hypothetical protein